MNLGSKNLIFFFATPKGKLNTPTGRLSLLYTERILFRLIHFSCILIATINIINAYGYRNYKLLLIVGAWVLTFIEFFVERSEAINAGAPLPTG